MLRSRIDQYPDSQFVVVINPKSGPGNESLLDPNYCRELPKLNAKTNVQTIGYVRTGWTGRNIDDVLHDVSVYASWADNKTADFALHGIFYDETPNKYTADGATFMARINEFVKNHDGFGKVNYVSAFSNQLIPDCA
jgi:hypothetical protein